MLFGHNSNVKVGEATFHVQTEDRGIATALIDTTVFYLGRVMHRRTNNYHDLVPLDPDREEALRLRLDEQHRSTLEDIRSGALYLAAPRTLTKEPAVAQAGPPETRQPVSLSENPPSVPAPPATNGANANVAGNGGGTAMANATASHDLGHPTMSALKLELRNANAWLSGKYAKLEIRVATPAGDPLPGARVTAYVEGAASPETFSAETDASGNTLINFEMPRLAGGPAALVIEAAHDHGAPMSRATAHGKLRFALRTKPRPA